MAVRESRVGTSLIGTTEEAPDSPAFFSQSMIVSGNSQLVFTSGFNSRDPETNEVIHVGDVVAQTRTTLQYLSRVLAECGASLGDVVKLAIFYADVADMKAVREVRREFFPVDPPVCTGVGVQLPDPKLLVEIEAIAVIPRVGNN